MLGDQRLVLLLWSIVLTPALAAKAVVNSNLLAVVVGPGLGLVSRQLPDGEDQVFPLPYTNDGGDFTVNNFDDVAIDPDNPSVFFAVSASPPDPIVCMFQARGETLQLRYCVYGFEADPYIGISVRDGKMAIAGGTGGLTVYNYDIEDMSIETRPVFSRSQVTDSAVMYTDALMVSPGVAVLSTEFDDDDCSYGTSVVDVSGSTPNEINRFCVDDNIGSDFSVSPSNFALESALYNGDDGNMYLYTAGGSLTVQTLGAVNTTRTLSVSSNQLLSVAVNQEKDMLVVAGVDDVAGLTTDSFSVEIFDIADPLRPILVNRQDILGRLASVATDGEYVVHANTQELLDGGRSTSYGFFELPSSAPTVSPAPSTITESPTPRPTAAPTRKQFVQVDPSTQSANTVMTSSLVAVSTGAGMQGLVSQQLPDGEEKLFKLPYEDSITTIEDVTTDDFDQSLLFTLSAMDKFACSFRIQDDASLELLGCAVLFDTSTYRGIAARNGMLVVSGGETGFVTFAYDTTTGVINADSLNSRDLHDGAVSYPDAVMIDDSTVALSTEYFVPNAPNSKFGTKIVDIEDDNTELRDFFVTESIDSSFGLTPSNFPLESATYEYGENRVLMYTANGALTIQNPYDEGSTNEIVFEDFSVFTLAVNPEKEVLCVGGVNGRMEHSIRLFSIVLPEEPEFYYDLVGIGRVTSIASRGGHAGFTMTAVAGTTRASFYQHFELPEPEDVDTVPPEGVPTGSPTKSPTTSPTLAPFSAGSTPRANLLGGLTLLMASFVLFL